MVEGHWILGMIERNGNGGYRIEICPDNRRSEADLILHIQKHVAPGTEIHTDLWKGYYNLSSYGYDHFTVNHSENLNLNLESGAYTQNIEASWRHLRKRLSRGGIKDNLDLHLCEFLWRSKIEKHGLDPFKQLFRDIIDVYPGGPQKPDDIMEQD